MSLDAFLDRCHGFDDSVYGLVEEFHGSVSAEHGIGLLKREHLHHTRAE
jgi:FAD/FMN-containing dehydrogenase